MHLPEGTLLCGGKYEIVRYISSGGFGCTYEARNTAFRNRTVTVAIKEFFVKDFCNRDAATNNVVVGTNSREALVEKLKSKFMDEAEALYALNHPNIVRVTDLFEDKNTVYYVMDYIEGGSLSGIISEKGRLAEKEALGYILQIADALKYVHSHNCLHLDVKPQNIMIDNSGKATLIDFGVSKQYDEANGENTSTLMGSTPGYAPIEQTGACMAKFYPASDIYALGATLYKALTGITPPPASLIASGERELDPLPATVSAAVQRAVEASMQLNRSKRPQSIGEFLRLVESGESKDESGKSKDESGEMKDERAKSSDATSLSMGTGQNASNGNAADEQENIAVEVVETPPVAPGPAPRPQPEENQKKNKWLWIIILLAIICVALGGFMLFGGGGNDELADTSVKRTEQKTVKTDTANKENDKLVKKENEEDKVNTAFATAAINGHEYVDLGLPSGLKWATCNVGASKPEGYGNHYAWGETSTKSSYTKGNSVTYDKNFSDISGNPTYDVARKQWGSPWRLPTKAEFEELRNENNCTWTWTEQNGVEGYKVTSRKNGNSIFLPAAGWRNGTSLLGQGIDGNYMSSTPNESYSYYAYYLFFSSGYHRTSWTSRYYGHSVRPVLNKSDSVVYLKTSHEPTVPKTIEENIPLHTDPVIRKAFKKGLKSSREAEEENEQGTGEDTLEYFKESQEIKVSPNLESRVNTLVSPQGNITQRSCTVVVRVVVAPDGTVRSATIAPGTNTSDSKVRNAALKAARSKNNFNAINNVDNVEGTITYRFNVK